MHLRWEYLLVLTLCAGLAWFSLRERLPAWLGGEVEIVVTFAAVNKRAVPLTLPVSGTLAPANTLTVVSRLAGRITEMRFKLGDAVPAGAVVATVFPGALVRREQEIEAGLGAARKELQGKQDQLLAAEKLLEQRRDLLQRDLIARRDFEQADAAVQTARALVELARADAAQRDAMLNQARKIQTLAQIVAPMAGTISRRWVEPGAVIGESSPLLDIANDGASQFIGRVAGDQAKGLRQGLNARVWITDLADKKLEGTVTRVAAEPGKSGATTELQITIIEESAAVRAAVAAQGLIVLDRTTEVLLVPRAALIDSGGKPYVYKLGAGRALRQAVMLGATEGEFVVIQQGIVETDVVLVDNLKAIKAGSRVRRRPAN